jgi:poly(glycerol-phosphate) alpha-glucosyltransferase
MLFLGRFHHKKNLELFLAAWAATRQHISDCFSWRLVLAGWDQDGYKQYLQNQCRQLGLADSVLLTRPLFDRDKDAAFRNATAFVLPSIGEGLPMAVLEAWSYGLPVLMTDACNLPEGFKAEAAHRLRLSEPEMTKDLGQFLSSDNTRLHELGQNARRLVEERFRWQSVAQEFGEVYSWVKDRGSTPSSVIQC